MSRIALCAWTSLACGRSRYGQVSRIVELSLQRVCLHGKIVAYRPPRRRGLWTRIPEFATKDLPLGERCPRGSSPRGTLAHGYYSMYGRRVGTLSRFVELQPRYSSI
jgi:hypothetical protein